MTDRDRFAELVSLYYDDALDAGGVAELNELLESRPELAARFARLGRVHGGLRELESAGAAPAFRPRRPAAWIPVLFAAAAAIVVAFLAVNRSEAPPSETPAMSHPRAMLVVGDVPGGVGDARVRHRLESLGYKVSLVDDEDVTEAELDGVKLVVISESSRVEHVGDRFRHAPVPVLNCEPHLNGDLGLARPPLPGEYPGKTYRFRVRIVDPAHPLAAGLDGTVRVYESPGTVNWSHVDDTALLVATCDDDPQHAAIFGYESGTFLNGEALPARRVSFFLSNIWQDAVLLTPEGWKLFDAAVAWCSGRS